MIVPLGQEVKQNFLLLFVVKYRKIYLLIIDAEYQTYLMFIPSYRNIKSNFKYTQEKYKRKRKINMKFDLY